MSPRGGLAVVIPARNESDRIGATVRAAARIPGVEVVVVVDDGSADGTGSEAAAAGAVVVRHSRNRGKAAAMETGAEAVRVIEAEQAATARRSASAEVTPSATAAPDAGHPRHLLFLDADLAGTAEHAGPLAAPVLAGQADMTIAVFSKRVKRGGHGIVLGLSGAGIERATGWRPAEPLNGQRCLTRAAFEAARPLAAGWGAETGLTIDLLRKGMRIVEVEVPLAHRATGRDLGSQLHRVRQLVGVARALAVRQPWRQAAGHPDLHSARSDARVTTRSDAQGTAPPDAQGTAPPDALGVLQVRA
ncbi:MAG TPA: glycosyltransferase [Streptosporangiaceae bacterium]|nr:glycosyltransferase [Streptosporangiaceae bacterium]